METPRPNRKGPARVFRALSRGLGELLYPSLCLGCEAPISPPASPLCPRCTAGLERADAGRMAEQMHRLPGAAGGTLDDLFALWMFDKDGALQRVHHALKYGNLPQIGTEMGRLIGAAYRDRPGETTGAEGPDLILPVPLSRLRFYERGYNQSAMLAGGIAEVLGLPMREDVLIRCRVTRTQTVLTGGKRWDNVSGAFSVARPELVAHRRILLVDDLFTTGATAAAAAAPLRACGARSVFLATLGLARS